MSGQTTGWVLRNGPRDRAMRAVLITIADAANRDGEHAHPGMDAMVEGSLYSEGHVRRTIAKLMEDTWVEQTEQPGPGKAAEYRVLMEARDNAAHSARRSDVPPEGNAAHTPREQRANSAHPDARRPEVEAIGSNYVNGNANGVAAGATTVSEAAALCTLLADRVEQHRGARPKITAQWAKDMDLLVRRGPTEWDKPVELAPAYVAKMINGIFDVLAEHDAKGFCWADQVRSPGALRRHWDACQLAGKTKRNGASAKPRPGRDSDQRSLEELMHEANDRRAG